MIDNFDWTGAIVITGGIALLCVFFGALFKPLNNNSVANGDEDERETTEKESPNKIHVPKIALEDGGDNSLGIKPPVELNGIQPHNGNPVKNG